MDSKSEVGLRIELESSVFALEGRYQSGPRHPWHRIFATLVFQQSKADHQGHSSARALTTYFDVFWVCSCYQFNLNGTIEQPTLGQLRRPHDCAVFWFPSIAGDGLWGQPKLSPHTKHNVSSSESTATACSGISCCPSKWIVYGWWSKWNPSERNSTFLENFGTVYVLSYQNIKLTDQPARTWRHRLQQLQTSSCLHFISQANNILILVVEKLNMLTYGAHTYPRLFDKCFISTTRTIITFCEGPETCQRGLKMNDSDPLNAKSFALEKQI